MVVEDGDQFIGVPPGVLPEPAQAKSVEPMPVEADDLISLPPGVVDSGTYRMPTARPPKPASFDDAPAFFPVSAPGLPVPAPAIEPAPVTGESQAVDDATRASVGRRSAPAWRLTLPDGQQLLVEETTLIGRDPAHSQEWPQATLLPIADTGKTISKTHAALELSAGHLVVHDLNSTNGVFLEYAGGDETVVEPGTPTLVEHGAELSFGEFTVSVERS